MHKDREFGMWSTGWDPLFSVDGGSGNTYVKGSLSIGGGHDLVFKAGAGTPEDPNSPDDPGDIVFQAHDGTQKARIWSEPGSAKGLHLSGSDNTAKLTIDGNGNVGVGTTLPARRLHVHSDDWNTSSEIHTSGASSGFSFMDRTSGLQGDQGQPGQRWVLFAHDKSARLWTSGQGEVLQIRNNGELNVFGETSFLNNVLRVDRSWLPSPAFSGVTYTTRATLQCPTNDNSSIAFHSPGASRTALVADGPIISTESGAYFAGNVGIGTIEPTYRLSVAGGSNPSDPRDRCALHVGSDVSLYHDREDIIQLVKFGSDGNYQFLHNARIGHFGRNTLALHCAAGDALGFYSDGWKSLLEVEGDSGNTYIKGSLSVGGGHDLVFTAGAGTPEDPNSPDDPGDIVFQAHDGTQKARIWSEYGSAMGLHLSGSDNTPKEIFA